MSNLMDNAVINMPYELAMADEISRKQFYSRAQSVLKERDEALAKLAAMESKRVPADKQHRCAECGPVDDCTALYCVKCWESAHGPVLAVPDAHKKLIKKVAKALRDNRRKSGEEQYATWQPGTGYATDLADKLEAMLKEMLAAAPSHSQHGAPDWENEAKRAFWCGFEIGAGMGAVPILPRWDEYIAKRKAELFDRCPIHESEQKADAEVVQLNQDRYATVLCAPGIRLNIGDQLQTLRAHGLAENESEQGEAQ